MPVVTQEAVRAPRLHVGSFNGSWAGGLGSSRKTAVSEFVDLIHECENVVETPINGVGTNGSFEDWLRGGIGGWGTSRNILHAYKNISKHYKPGDRIILTGFSRGAWAARYLALLIHRLGLPKNGDAKLFNRIYKACKKSFIWDDAFTAKLLEGYECWENVKINALCCFDTVGSLGLPLTGIAKPFSILRGWKTQHDIVSDVSPNVEFAFHALSLHELREPFAPTLMHGPNVYEVSFPGGHSNVGWIEDTEGLVHGPFAWMIQQVHTYAKISFDETKMARRFPSYYPEGSDRPPDPTWYKGEIEHVNSGILALIGKKVRQPGCINSASGSSNLKVHIGARLRNDIDTDAVPCYVLMAPVEGRPYWTRRLKKPRWSWRTNSQISTSSSSTDASLPRRATRPGNCSVNHKAADRIEEAPVGPLEARLLGLPQSVVTASL